MGARALQKSGMSSQIRGSKAFLPCQAEWWKRHVLLLRSIIAAMLARLLAYVWLLRSINPATLKDQSDKDRPHGVIRPSKSKYASPVFSMKKGRHAADVCRLPQAQRDHY
jgi:hypothetical protein